MPCFRTLKNTHFNSAALIFFFPPQFVLHKQVGREKLEQTSIATPGTRSIVCLNAQVLRSGGGGGFYRSLKVGQEEAESVAEDSGSTCEPVGADAFCQSHQ